MLQAFIKYSYGCWRNTINVDVLCANLSTIYKGYKLMLGGDIRCVSII